jgi:subtilisin-like proprotein convertase family protein
MRNRLPHTSLLAAVLATLAFCATASADSRTFQNQFPVSPADPANGQPGIQTGNYPSQIRVGGMAGTVTDVKVDLRLVDGAFPADLDVLLVSPAGQKLVLMSDVGSGSQIDRANLTFSDSATTNLPATGNIASGTYKPTNLVGGDGSNEKWPFPAPAGPYDATTLSTFAGAEPNGKWSLYVTDDGAGDKNQIMGGWNLTVSTSGGKIFRDSTAIVATDRVSPKTPPGVATPYPATLDVTGATRKVDRMTATLHDIDFKATTDTDLLLVGPTGASVILLSDVGGGNHVSNEDLSFDDAAATPVLFSQPLEPGVHKPNNDDRGVGPDEPLGVDVFPAPAPGGPYGTSLGAFKGTDPNGTWKLYMVDDSHGGANAVNGGWSLNFTFSDQPVDPPPAPAPEPQPQSAPQPAPAPVPLPGPAKVTLSALKLKPSVFTVKKGTLVSYKLSGKAKVKLTVLRKGKVRASLTRASKAGANKLRFKPSKLTAGAYTLVVKPIGGAAVKPVTFKVKA